MANFELRKTYNFNTAAPTILGEKYSLMKVKSIMDYSEAVSYHDIVTEFETLKPIIPTLPDSVIDLTFILFEDINKETKLLALEYINDATIQEVKAIDIRVEILGVSTQDINIIKNRLVELGYNNIKIGSF